MIRILALIAVLPAIQAFFTLRLATTAVEQVAGAIWVLIAVVLFVAGVWPHGRSKIGKGYIAGYKMVAFSDGTVDVMTGGRRVTFASLADAERIFIEETSKSGRRTHVPIEFEGWGHGFDGPGAA